MIDIVVPTLGRPSLPALLASIERARGPRPQHVWLVDDRRDRTVPLDLGPLDADLAARIRIVAGRAAGPAAARNIGWRASRAEWIAFVDDDVVVDADWLAALAADCAACAPDVAASQGRVAVPLPDDRRPTDWERNVAALARARWITADCAYRRADLLAVGGFDERFMRAYREDADLALRVVARGKRIACGTRSVRHPVRPAPWWISIALQAGNADDVLMDALHGGGWRGRAGSPRGAFASHICTVASALTALAAAAARRRRIARIAAAAWLLLVGAFALRRIAPGPATGAEIARMLVTSTAIPFAAVAHRLHGRWLLAQRLADVERAPRPVAAAVLFDRDGTLIVDVPFNTDPAHVIPMPAARAALDTLRAAGMLTAVVSNQSGVGSGKLRVEDVAAINARTQELLGPLGPMFVCPHVADDACACRKPQPGLIYAAAAALGVRARDCVVVGDIGADIEAARAAGAQAILVATPVTRRAEIDAAPAVAADIGAAVAAILRGAF